MRLATPPADAPADWTRWRSYRLAPRGRALRIRRHPPSGHRLPSLPQASDTERIEDLLVDGPRGGFDEVLIPGQADDRRAGTRVRVQNGYLSSG